MEKREFGTTGYEVSVIGFGAGHIGKDGLDEKETEKLLNLVLDSGINLIDTARSYGLSEERIGKYICHRRSEYIISSKGGYTSENYDDWTYEIILENIDESLKKLRTEFIDIYHLHSCPLEVLERGEVIHALEKACDEGKIGIVAYSGENDALDFAIRSNRFGSIQCSVNICDQNSIDNQVHRADESGFGIIAKRPAANAPWRFDTPPVGHHSAEYWHRFKKMNLNNFGMDWQELAMRFSAYTPGVSTVITGTSDIRHLHNNIKSVEKGPLPAEIIEYLKAEFKKNDKGWEGLI